jgi:diguanylate cyclase (GGDEF)-like protein
MFLQFRQKEAELVQSIFKNEFSHQLATLEQQMSKRHDLEDEEYRRTRFYLIGYSVFLFLVILLFVLNRHRLLKIVSTHQMLSEKDQLTGLNNRRHFIQEFERVLSSPWKNELCSAIIFIDLDGFKAINDNLGHNAGDKVLQRISKRLRNQSCSNQEDGINNFIARLGGDEFVILLDNISKNNRSETLNKVVEQTLLLCSQDLGTKYKQFPLTASLGVVTFSDQSKSIADLLHFADLAMYQSKKEGKNCCNFYEN